MTWLLVTLCVVLAAATTVFAIRAVSLSIVLQRERDELQRKISAENEKVDLIEADARRTDSELQGLMLACDEAVIILDHHQVVLVANDNARAVFPRVSDLGGRTLAQISLSTEMVEIAGAALKGSRILRREVRLPGAAVHVLIVSAVPIELAPDGDAGCLLAARDVTDIRRLETVRTDFVANVSHEMRTPLASIRAMAETLHEGALEDPAVSFRFLETIIDESDRLTRIAQDLLVLTAAESGPPPREDVDISGLLREAVDHLEPQASKSELAFFSEVAPDMRVSGSADQLRQVLLNLIDNAIKYTRPGGKIDVRGFLEDSFVVIRVQDTGLGILSEHLPRIFERFYRVDKGRSRASGGTGLGLSIVKHIVDSHGGSVSVDSEYNRGSTFTVKLPSKG